MCRIFGCSDDEGYQSGRSGRKAVPGEGYIVLQGAGVSFSSRPHIFFALTRYDLRSDASMKEVSEILRTVTKKHGGNQFEFAQTEAEATNAWQGRKAALWSVQALKENGRVWTTDVWYVQRRSISIHMELMT